VNVAHQLGSSVGLSVLVAVAGTASAGLVGNALSVSRVHAAFDAGTVMLVLALAVVLTTIVRRVTARPDNPAGATDAA
jgi:hypothetical protein